MTTCQACGGQITSSDRFCRNCGARIASLVGDLVETHPFDSTDTAGATEQHDSGDVKDRFCVPPRGVERAGPGPSPSYQAGSFVKQLVDQKRNWLLIVPIIVLMFALLVGAGIAIGRVLHRAQNQPARTNGHRQPTAPSDTDDAIDDSDQEVVGDDAGEAVKNGLGLVPSEVPDDEYPNIEGVFVGSLKSDNGPAAQAHIQAGDILTQLGDEPVTDADDIAEALKSREPGAEIAAKLYRDGETVSTNIKIADPAHPPFGQDAVPSNQGFLGLGDVERRCCIPGTKKWGLEINRIVDNSPADLAGLEKGDVITEFDKHTVRTPDELARRIRAATPRTKVMIKFYRGASEQTAEVLMGHGSDDDESNKE